MHFSLIHVCVQFDAYLPGVALHTANASLFLAFTVKVLVYICEHLYV